MSTAQQPAAAIKHIPVDRSQLSWEVVDLEQLIAANHLARIVWEVSGKLDLSAFEEHSKSKEGSAGRPCWSAQVLVSVWVYAYSIGAASARAIERLMEHEPGLRWLTGNQVINHHTLADFRVGNPAALEILFAKFLALMDQEGILDLSTILHDGTKVGTVAGRGSFHRRATLEKRLGKARRVMRALDRKAEQEREPMEAKRAAAQQRAAREAVERIDGALKHLGELESQTRPEKRTKLRVSASEAEARKMKQPDGGFAPSYNVQVSTEAQSRFIVSVGVTQAANDTHELVPAVERVHRTCGELPATVIADNGYATRANVEQTSDQGIELIAPWKEQASREAGACVRNGIAAAFAPSAFRGRSGGRELMCPASKRLVVIAERVHHGVRKRVFAAEQRDCRRCRFRERCCGPSGGPRRVERVIESQAMRQYLARMKKKTTKVLYKKRAEIAEFPHLWTKGVKKWRRFSVRGLVKAGMEAMWVALAYNMAQWIRIRATARSPIAA
jgi:transposase